MKRTILLSITAACMLLQCCTHARDARGGQDTAPYAQEIAHLDSLRWLIAGTEFPEGVAVDADSVLHEWKGFAELYCRGEHEAAYEYLKNGDRYGDIIIYLRNSTAVYEFVSGAWNVCVSAHAESDEAYFREIERDYSFVLAMTRSVVELGGDDPYVPPHYMALVMELGSIIMKARDYEKAETFDDEIYRASIAMYGHEPMASLLALSFRCPLLCRTGREDQARKELASFRSKTMKACTGEDFEKLLKGVDAIEKSMKQE